jgi:hypothetical protein
MPSIFEHLPNTPISRETMLIVTAAKAEQKLEDHALIARLRTELAAAKAIFDVLADELPRVGLSLTGTDLALRAKEIAELLAEPSEVPTLEAV